MKSRFKLEYQLFIHGVTGVATCRLINVKLQPWVNEETTPIYYYLLEAVTKVKQLYSKNGWPVATATPSEKAKLDPEFGMKLAKKRLIHAALTDLNNVIINRFDRKRAMLNRERVEVVLIRTSIKLLNRDIEKLYETAGVKEGDYYAPDILLSTRQRKDRYNRNHGGKDDGLQQDHTTVQSDDK